MAKRKTTINAPKAPTSQPKTSAKYRGAIDAANKASTNSRVWRPQQEGDAVGGVILSHVWRQGKDRPWCAITLDTGEEVIQVRLNVTSLRAFTELGIRDGATIGIVYKGEVPSSYGPGRPAKLMAVAETSKGKGELIVNPDDWAEQERSRASGRGKRQTKKGKKGGRRVQA